MPPEIFFIDRSLGSVRFAAALREAGIAVVAHDDRFAPDTPDTEWLEAAGREEWIVLTKDSAIRYRPIEKEALLKAGVAAFTFTRGNQRVDELLTAFLKALPRIRSLMSELPRPFLASISSAGGVRVLL